MTAYPYASSVFINCPFTHDFKPMFRAMVFAVVDLGFIPRCALEEIDGGATRIWKINRIIEACKLGIHDISNMELDAESGLPRFNMPFELGLFLGAKRFGEGRQKTKRVLIMDSAPYRYQAALSDVSGQDIQSHAGKPEQAIRCVRDWLSNTSSRKRMPGASLVVGRYRNYEADFPDICAALQFDEDILTFNDLWETMTEWQKANAS